MKYLIYLLTLIFVSGCSLINKPKLVEVTQDDLQFVGVAVSKEGRMFLSYPRWLEDYKYGVVEVLNDGTKKPYPNEKWNLAEGTPQDRFICAQSVHIDENDFLWILDPASPKLEGIVQGGPKLVKVDLKNNSVVQKILIDETIATTNSYLNDVRIDAEKNKAYITDSGTGGIVIVDLNSGKQRKVLTTHYSTMAEPAYIVKVNKKEWRNLAGEIPQVHSDGIALDAKNNYLYYHPLTGKTLYRISLDALNNESLTEEKLGEQVEKLLDTGSLDGLITDETGNVFLTAIEENAIKYYTPNGKVKTLIKHKNIIWPDSFSIGPNGYLYFTTSLINQMPWFNDGINKRKTPYKVYKVDIKNLT